MSRWHTTKDENFIDAPSRSVTGGGSRTTPRAVLQGYFLRLQIVLLKDQAGALDFGPIIGQTQGL